MKLKVILVYLVTEETKLFATGPLAYTTNVIGIRYCSDTIAKTLKKPQMVQEGLEFLIRYGIFKVCSKN